MTPAEFADWAKPYADKASQATGLPVSVIIAQWGVETGWGTSKLFRQHNNLGGIQFRPAAKAGGTQAYSADGTFAGYTSYDQFVSDYVRVWSQNAFGYPEARAAAKASYSSPVERAVATARAVGASGYDAGHYREDSPSAAPGESLVRAITSYGLISFDQPTTGPAPAIASKVTIPPPTTGQAVAAGIVIVFALWGFVTLLRWVTDIGEEV